MEENLTVKTVPFMGADLMAAKDKATGKIYAGVRWMCDGIGLTTGQMQNERARIHTDIVLAQGERNLVLPTKGGNQEVQCIDREFIPMWLAKISITPAMQAEHPEVADRLIQYQLRAAKVLADAFLHNKKPNSKEPTEYQNSMMQYRTESAHIRRARELERLSNKYPGSTFGQVLDSYATVELTGERLIPLPQLSAKTYTAEEIGAQLGISANKVGRLANQHGLKTAEFGGWFNDKAKSSDKEVQSFRYYESVVPTLRSLLGGVSA